MRKMTTHIVSNTTTSVVLSRKQGNLEKVLCGGRCWNAYHGTLTIVDEMTGRIFNNTSAKIKTIKPAGHAEVSFEKSYAGADITVKETWKAFEDCLSWRVEVFLQKASRPRSIRIKQFFPYPYCRYGKLVWAANERFPCALEKLGGMHLYYGDPYHGTVIPAVALYDKQGEAGITLAKPFGMETARLAFCFTDYYSDGLEVENSCLALTGKHPAAAEVLIRSHAGCWRPGLAWLYGKYPEYFDPPNPKVRDLEGGFMITNPFTRNKLIKGAKKYDVKWAEIHNHFPCYGNYTPEEKEWKSVIAHDYPELPPLPKVSKKRINDHLAVLHKNGIKGLLYFQSSDAYIPYAEKKFPDAIVRDCAGKIISTWKECCLVDASSSTSFGRHIGRQIEKFVNDYPGIDGVFFDQMGYHAIDTAHNDGITAYENKPAAMFIHSYSAALKKMAGIMHGQGKIVWGNAPYLEFQKAVDGIMAEGSGEIAEPYKYLCIVKPLLVHVYPDNPEKVEGMFKYCLLAGASYSIGGSSKVPVPPQITADVRRLFGAYIPLVEKLYGRTWLLEPSPLELPAGFQANIFKGADDKSVIVTLVNYNDSILRKGKLFDRNIKFRVKIKNAAFFSEAACLTTHRRHPQKGKIVRDGESLFITIPEHAIASVVIIK